MSYLISRRKQLRYDSHICFQMRRVWQYNDFQDYFSADTQEKIEKPLMNSQTDANWKQMNVILKQMNAMNES